MMLALTGALLNGSRTSVALGLISWNSLKEGGGSLLKVKRFELSAFACYS
jgi:hypothetical protein